MFLLLVFYFENIFVVGFFYGFCNYKFQIQLYVVSKNSYNLKPHTQLAIPFSKWKAKYFCPVENFLKRVVVNLRRAQKIRTTKRRAFHDENGLQIYYTAQGENPHS